jgi:hypothetical protein
MAVRDRSVDLAPPDVFFTAWFLDNELVVRRTAGVLSGPGDNRPQVGHQSFVPLHDMLVQHGCRQIPEGPGCLIDPDLVQTPQSAGLVSVVSHDFLAEVVASPQLSKLSRFSSPSS